MAPPPTYAPDMDCSVVHDALVRGDLTDEAARAHAEGCAGCGELWAEEAALGRLLASASPEPDAASASSALRDRLASESRRSPRRWRTGTKAVVVVGAAVAWAAFVARFQPRADLGELSTGQLAVVLGGLAGVGLVGLAWVLRPLHRPESPGLRALALGVLGVGPLALMLLPSSHAGDPGHGPAALGVCFALASAYAVAGVGLFAALDPRLHPSWERVAGYAGLGAVLGAVYLQLHCPYTGLLHTSIAHGLVVTLWVGALWSWGRLRGGSLR